MDFYLKYRWYTIIKQCKKILQLAMLYYANVIMCFIAIWHWRNVASVWCLIRYCLIMFHEHHLFMYDGYNSEWTSIDQKHDTFLFKTIHIYESIVRTFRFYVFSCVTSSDSLHQFSGDLPLALGDETLLC